MIKIVFFDCDETIWTSPTKDYISSVVSDLKPISKNKLTRVSDRLVFTLKPGTRKLFAELSKREVVIGIISDNRRKPVVKALSLFKLLPFINKMAISIKLWRGYCPKHKMLISVLKKPDFKNISGNEVLWVDDKDYSSEAAEIGVNFIKISQRSNIYKKVYAEL